MLTELTALAFPEAWAGRLQAPFGPVVADFLGREALIANNRLTTGPAHAAARALGSHIVF